MTHRSTARNCIKIYVLAQRRLPHVLRQDPLVASETVQRQPPAQRVLYPLRQNLRRTCCQIPRPNPQGLERSAALQNSSPIQALALSSTIAESCFNADVLTTLASADAGIVQIKTEIASGASLSKARLVPPCD